jgi:hypothetical protein
MQIFGTQMSLVLGSWRLQFVIRLDDVALPADAGDRIIERSRFSPQDGDSENRLSRQRRGRCLG